MENYDDQFICLIIILILPKYFLPKRVIFTCQITRTKGLVVPSLNIIIFYKDIILFSAITDMLE